MTRSASAWLVAPLIVLLSGCGHSAARTPPTQPASNDVVTAKAAVVAAPTVPRPAIATDVRAELRGPARIQYRPSVLGPGRPTLRVTITNRGREPLDVGDLRVHLSALREGVAFPCTPDAGASPDAREPRSLPSNTTATFERTVDCSLPLVGVYAVRVGVSFGHGDWASTREVKTFALGIFAAEDTGPRPIEGVTGLYGVVGANPLLPGGIGAGVGHIIVALVNGGQAPLEMPRLRLALRVYRLGSAIPCEDEPLKLAAPRVLSPGAVYQERIEVSCLGLEIPGRYEVIARILGEPDRETEVGRLRIDVGGPLQTPQWLWPPGVGAEPRR